MQKPLRSLPSLLVLLALLTAPAEAGLPQVLRVSDRRVITFQQMVDDLKKASVVFVGELHDDTFHHADQLDIIRAFHESDHPTAVGLEMFRADSQKTLNDWTAGTITFKKFLASYYDNWTVPWQLYSDIFLYAREHQIPLRGLNIPDRIATKIALEGFGSLTASEKKRIPPGISCNVDPTYMAFIKRAYRGHPLHEGNGFLNFCEAQMVWDKSMAYHLMEYLRKRPGTTMVVLAGMGHAWKRGIAEQLDDGMTTRVVLPVIPGQVDRNTVTTADADYLLLDH